MFVVFSTVSTQSKLSTNGKYLGAGTISSVYTWILKYALSFPCVPCTRELAGTRPCALASEPWSLWRGAEVLPSGVHDFLTPVSRKFQEHCEPSTRNLRRGPSTFCINQRDKHNRDSGSWKRRPAWGERGRHPEDIKSRTNLRALAGGIGNRKYFLPFLPFSEEQILKSNIYWTCSMHLKTEIPLLILLDEETKHWEITYSRVAVCCSG